MRPGAPNAFVLHAIIALYVFELFIDLYLIKRAACCLFFFFLPRKSANMRKHEDAPEMCKRKEEMYCKLGIRSLHSLQTNSPNTEQHPHPGAMLHQQDGKRKE